MNQKALDPLEGIETKDERFPVLVPHDQKALDPLEGIETSCVTSCDLPHQADQKALDPLEGIETEEAIDRLARLYQSEST